MKHTIHVMQDHIDRARPGNVTCPVALAIQDHLPGSRRIRVYPELAFNEPWIVEIDSLSMQLPETAAQLARDFDQHKPISPMSFELDIP